VPKFVKGQSGNPGGRPRATPAKTDLLAEIHRQLAQAGPEGLTTRSEELVQALIDQAAAGNIGAMRTILERVHGPVMPVKASEVDLVAVAMEVKRRVEAGKGDGAVE
jgi:Family of unknown function (DUF5681)